MHRLKSLPAWLINLYFLLLVVAGSLYLLLVNVSFADQWIVRSPIFDWIPTLVHAFLPAYAAGVALAVWRLYRAGKQKSPALLAFLVAQVAFVAALAWFK